MIVIYIFLWLAVYVGTGTGVLIAAVHADDEFKRQANDSVDGGMVIFITVFLWPVMLIAFAVILTIRLIRRLAKLDEPRKRRTW